MKDHQIAEIVNALRDAAVTHHASGQLRERLRSCIEPLLIAIAPPVAAGSVEWCNEVNMDGLREENAELRQRAEKAEADLAQVKANHAFLVERNRALKDFADTTQSAFGVLLKKHRELQSSLAAAKPYDLNA